MVSAGLPKIFRQDRPGQAGPDRKLACLSNLALAVELVEYRRLVERDRQAHRSFVDIGPGRHGNAGLGEPGDDVLMRVSGVNLRRRAFSGLHLLDRDAGREARLGLAESREHEIDAEARGDLAVVRGKRLHDHLFNTFMQSSARGSADIR